MQIVLKALLGLKLATNLIQIHTGSLLLSLLTDFLLHGQVDVHVLSLIFFLSFWPVGYI